MREIQKKCIIKVQKWLQFMTLKERYRLNFNQLLEEQRFLSIALFFIFLPLCFFFLFFMTSSTIWLIFSYHNYLFNDQQNRQKKWLYTIVSSLLSDFFIIIHSFLLMLQKNENQSDGKLKMRAAPSSACGEERQKWLIRPHEFEKLYYWRGKKERREGEWQIYSNTSRNQLCLDKKN